MFSMLFFVSCSGSEQKETSTDELSEETTEQPAEEIAAAPETSFYGTFTLTDMIPMPGDKELTEQDTKYIDDSKARTLNTTKLTLNEDGTLERVFPHPSGDGSTNTWTGTYEMDEAAGTMIWHVEMNGKTMDMDFKILEKSDNRLSVSTSFGQIDMNYIYTK